MYAIVVDRGKQYKVEEGQTLAVDRLELAKGDKVEFSDVVLYSKGDDVRVGKPNVAGVRVEGKVEEPIRKGEKLVVFRYKRRDHFRKKNGHRQTYTTVKIEKIEAQG